MEKYRDLPMDLADATAVALAESQRISKVFTLDHRDFKIYKPAHLKSFALLPSNL